MIRPILTIGLFFDLLKKIWYNLYVRKGKRRNKISVKKRKKVVFYAEVSGIKHEEERYYPQDTENDKITNDLYSWIDGFVKREGWYFDDDDEEEL